MYRTIKFKNLKALKNLVRLRNVMEIGKIQFAKEMLEETQFISFKKIKT